MCVLEGMQKETADRLRRHKWVFRNEPVYRTGFSGGSVVKNLPANAGDARGASSISGFGRFSLAEEMATLPFHFISFSVFLPGKFPGQRSLVGYSPRGGKEFRHDSTHSLCTEQMASPSWVLLHPKRRGDRTHQHLGLSPN